MMDKYIERKALLNALKEEQKNGNFVFTSKWIKEIIDNLQTADVVPKSEAERWRRNLEAVLKEIPETKREVAREIFEEIEKAVEDAEFEWGTIYGVKLFLAELKKKYTEV